MQPALVMLLALLPALLAVALFVATLRLTPPPPARLTWLPPQPATAKS
jgi:hypothetical protein